MHPIPVSLVIPDVLEESCATRQALERLAAKWRVGMEADGLVERRVLKESAPQHVEYSLTELGATLREPLAAVCAWAAEHA